MAQEPPRIGVPVEDAPADDGFGLDRIVTALALAATLALILLSPMAS